MSDELDNVKVSVENITPQTHWEKRHELFKQVKRSRGIYMSLSDDQRYELVNKIHGTLAVMLDRIEDWLPDSFTGEEVGECLNIELKLVMADIDSSISDTIESSTTRMKKISQEMEKELLELEEEESDDTGS